MLIIARISEVIKNRIETCEENPEKIKSEIMQKLMRFCDENGNTLLHFAAWKNDKDLLYFLTSNLPEECIYAKNKQGNTPLHIAAWKCTSVPYGLYKREARNIQNKKGNTPLHTAILNGNFDIIMSLTTKENVNIQNERDNTPLHIAAWKNHRHAIRILLAKGSKLHAINKDGQFPIDLVKCRFSREELAYPTGKLKCFTDEDHQSSDFIFHALTHPAPDPRVKVRINSGDNYHYFFPGSGDISRRAAYHRIRRSEFYKKSS